MPTFISDDAMSAMCAAVANSADGCRALRVPINPFSGLFEAEAVEFYLFGDQLNIWREGHRELIEADQAPMEWKPKGPYAERKA